jgi:hypothetical protein
MDFAIAAPHKPRSIGSAKEASQAAKLSADEAEEVLRRRKERVNRCSTTSRRV